MCKYADGMNVQMCGYADVQMLVRPVLFHANVKQMKQVKQDFELMD